MNALCFLVMWTVSVTVMAPCPNAAKADPYTGEYPGFSMTSCAVLHYQTVEKNMLKSFNTRGAAQEFINDAPENIKPNMKINNIECAHDNSPAFENFTFGPDDQYTFTYTDNFIS